MFFDETNTIELCEDDPTVIFKLIDEGHKELTSKMLTKKLVSVNTTNEYGNDVITYMLQNGWYDEVLKFMKDKSWDVNHQNENGDTFAHILVGKKYLEVMGIVKQLLKNDNYVPNIMNNKQETILDKSMDNNNISMTIKILEDERFDNINLVSVRNLYEKYIKNKAYGIMSKVNNLEIIVDSLQEKDLMPRVENFINKIVKNYKEIKAKVFNNDIKQLDEMFYTMFNACLER